MSARQNAIAIETQDGGGAVRRALLEDCIFQPDEAHLTRDNKELLDEFERTLDRSMRVIGVTAIRAFRNTGAASPRSEAAAAEVRSLAATHHSAFPIVAIVAKRTTSAPCELVSIDAANKRATVRFSVVATPGQSASPGAKAPTISIPVRFVLSCRCDRALHGDFMMPWSHFDTADDAASGGRAPGTSASPAKVLARQLAAALRQLERFLDQPPPQFALDPSPFLPLRDNLREALALLENAKTASRRGSSRASRPVSESSTPVIPADIGPEPLTPVMPIALEQALATHQAHIHQHQALLAAAGGAGSAPGAAPQRRVAAAAADDAHSDTEVDYPGYDPVAAEAETRSWVTDDEEDAAAGRPAPKRQRVEAPTSAMPPLVDSSFYPPPSAVAAGTAAAAVAAAIAAAASAPAPAAPLSALPAVVGPPQPPVHRSNLTTSIGAPISPPPSFFGVIDDTPQN